MKRIVFVVSAVVAVAVVAALGYRVYLGVRAGDGQISRQAQADRTFVSTNQSDTPLGIIQYGVTTGEEGGSRAQFLIEETIFGRKNVVEGTTRQLDGGFLVDYNRHEVQVGQFEINMRDIKTRSLDVDIESRGWTDSERDTVIRAQILESGRDEFEFATFDPTGVSGVPESFQPGDRLDLVVTGNLTIRDVTRSVDFDMQLSLDSDEVISGTASTTVRWADFGITIPYVGGGSDVGAVSDTVELRLEFTAQEEARVGV